MATAPAHLLLILDTETSGIDAADHHVLEIAAILYSVEHQCVLQQISTLIPGNREDNPAQFVNNIPITAVNDTPGELAEYLCRTITYWGEMAEYVVAHNAPFDRKWFKDHPIFASLYDQQWLCTCHEFTWPQQHRPGQKLIDLALAHGIGVSSAHRALTDCQLIASLFDRMEDLPGMIAQAATPKVLVRADVSFKDKQLAKDAGFRWDGKGKQWTLRMNPAEAEKLPFAHSLLAEDGMTVLSASSGAGADDMADASKAKAASRRKPKAERTVEGAAIAEQASFKIATPKAKPETKPEPVDDENVLPF